MSFPDGFSKVTFLSLYGHLIVIPECDNENVEREKHLIPNLPDDRMMEPLLSSIYFHTPGARITPPRSHPSSYKRNQQKNDTV